MENHRFDAAIRPSPLVSPRRAPIRVSVAAAVVAPFSAARVGAVAARKKRKKEQKRTVLTWRRQNAAQSLLAPPAKGVRNCAAIDSTTRPGC